ncbi:ABC transporter substrate-binding protein [Bradyrhizobium sp. NP1]|uniref:ABC transporter substrate-binding protein n=1 Tax=Bradyrhizobium sp. NP1 TaxID=3049772 RepID=UPI0025A6679E|nr:ABC transporter substrate-binding protein [Bradyrhizobium sp. NP1]WJR77204.1 ABC transporter substrate-binding protein [Bradyrhizobium sp. NP1]
MKVGTFVSVADAPIFIAVEKGYFAQQNIKVELSQITTGALATTALASGALDVAGNAPSAGLYNAIRQGIDIKLVADKGSSPPGHGYMALVARSEIAGEIKSASDLAGRTVAVAGFNTGVSNEVMMARLTEPAGVKANSVNFIQLSFADTLAGLGTGRVDVGVLVEPLVTQAVEKGVGRIWRRVDEVYPGQQYTVIIYGPGIVGRPDVADRFMVAYLQGARFYNDALAGRVSREELVDILVKHTTVKDRSLYDKMVFPGINPKGYLNVEGMAEDMKWYVQAGQMRKEVDLKKIVDHSYVDRALKVIEGK